MYKLGMTDESIKTIQTVVGVTVTGTFDEATMEAVKRYQTKNNLVSDGVVGPITMQKILNDFVNNAPAKKPIFVIIDAGHGYETPGKCGKLKDGTMFEEWEFNRILALRLISELNRQQIAFAYMTESITDIPLGQRINMVDAEYAKRQQQYRCIMVSLHADAIDNNTTAKGLSVWTSRGQDESDKLASHIWQAFNKLGISIRKDTTDGDEDYEAGFAMNKVKCPSVLIEHGFMTTLDEVEQLFTASHQEKLVRALIEGIKAYQATFK